jgi:rhodanese-related sulfurtransferase
MTLPYGTSISVADYSNTCRTKYHILLDVRSESQFELISFRHYHDLRGTVLGEATVPHMKLEPDRYLDPCESKFSLEYCISTYVVLLNFPLSELKGIHGADLKKNILRRLRSTRYSDLFDYRNQDDLLTSRSSDNSNSGDRLLGTDGTSEMRSDVDTDLGMEVFCVCRRGVDSILATQILQSAGIKSVYNVAGGLTAWSSTVDPSFPVY